MAVAGLMCVPTYMTRPTLCDKATLPEHATLYPKIQLPIGLEFQPGLQATQ